MLIDTHMHLWSLARGDYDWLTPELPQLYRDFDFDDYAAATKQTRLTGCVLVQAAPTIAETDWLLAIAARHPKILGVVGWIDLTEPVDQARLSTLRANRLVGVRPMLQDWPDASRILSPICTRGFDALEASGLVFDALVRPHQLGVIAALADRHPALTIVIDHGAKPAIADSAWQPWADDIAALAARGNVRCKLSGLVLEAEPGVTIAQLSPYVSHLADCFGDDRLIWGSDWPLVEMRISLGGWHAMATQLAAELGLSLDKLFWGNARTTYALEEPLYD